MRRENLAQRYDFSPTYTNKSDKNVKKMLLFSKIRTYFLSYPVDLRKDFFEFFWFITSDALILFFTIISFWYIVFYEHVLNFRFEKTFLAFFVLWNDWTSWRWVFDLTGSLQIFLWMSRLKQRLRWCNHQSFKDFFYVFLI